jgi:hypothetical protein
LKGIFKNAPITFFVRQEMKEMLAALIRPVGNLHWLVDRAAFPA